MNIKEFRELTKNLPDKMEIFIDEDNTQFDCYNSIYSFDVVHYVPTCSAGETIKKECDILVLYQGKKG